MSQQLGHPEAVTVFAIDLISRQGGGSAPASQKAFGRLLADAVALDCTLQLASRQDGRPAFTVVEPESKHDLATLRRLLGFQAEFAAAYPDSMVRFVVHHGLVFAAPGSQGQNYLGSGVRSAHSHLNRLPESLHYAVTEEFVSATQLWDACPLHFEPLMEAEPTPSASSPLPGMMRFTLTSEGVAKSEPGTNADDELKRFLSESLATYLGPFAEVLVDVANRSGLSPASLVDEVSREISDLPARVRFREDAMAFLAHRRDVQPA